MTKLRELASGSSSGWSILDQALVSGSNFIVGILLARTLGLEAFGAYVIAQTYLLYANTFQSALVVSPMMTAVPAEAQADRQRLLRGFFGYMLLVLLATAVGVQGLAALLGHWVPTLSLGALALPLAAAMAAFQLQDWLRRTLYVRTANRLVFLADAVAYGGQLGILAFLAATGRLTPALALWTMAGSFVAAAVLMALLTRLLPHAGSTVAVIRQHWRASRDYLASWQLQWFGSAGIILFGSGYVGVQAAGAIKAVQNLLGPVNVFFQWMDNVMPVRATQRYRQGGVHALANYLARVNGAGLLALGAATLLLLAIDDWLMLRLYGPAYAPFAMLVVYQAAYYLFGHAYRMQSYYNRTLGQTPVLARASAFWAAGSVLCALVAVPWLEERGIMLALVLGEVVALAYLVRWRRAAANPDGASGRFALVPLPSGTSLLLPMANRAVMRGVLSMYFPSRWKGRLYRRAVALLLPVWGWLGVGRTSAGPDVLVRHLDQLVAQVPGASSQHTGALVARDGDKLTLILMDVQGRALAFARLATSAPAMAAVTQEARMLALLADTPVAGGVPRAVASGALVAPDAFFLVETAGPADLTPYSLDERHFAFLDGLRRPGAQGDAWARRLQDLASACEGLQVDAAAASLLRDALARLQALPPIGLPACVEHGDFAPWNIRQRPEGTLFVLDWESAEPQGLPWLDALHFCHQVRVLVHRDAPAAVLQHLRALFDAPVARAYRAATCLPGSATDALILVYVLRALLAERRVLADGSVRLPEQRLHLLETLCAEMGDET